MAIQGVTPECMEVFYAHLWPGNVRELEHVIEGAMNIIGEDEYYIDVHHLPPNMVPQHPMDRNLTELDNCTLPEAVDLVERGMIKRAMAQTAGNITRAARLLGITRQSLQYKLSKFREE
jgi:arginine utilization regulatory protein